MSKVQQYRDRLRALGDWEPYLREESGLPGPRGNLELAEAAVDEGDETLFRCLLSYSSDVAPTNTPGEFLAFCGVAGLGKLVAEGRCELFGEMRQFASDPRWRVREAVAIGLQRVGKTNMALLLHEMESWCSGNLLEARAAAAAMCEPALLVRKDDVTAVLRLLDRVTELLHSQTNRRTEPFRVLRQGLAYCWSVALAACPEAGKAAMEKWLASDDPDVRWVMKENLKKNRLARVDPAWVAAWQVKLGA